MSLASHKVDALLKEGKFGSKDLKFIKDRSDKLLITILIWNNLVNTFTAAFATVMATDIASKSGIEESLAVWVATWIITLLLLIFGEIAPKSFATKNAEKISLSVAKLYRFLMFLLAPIVYLLEKIIQVFTWKAKQEELSEWEIEAFIDMGKNSWTLEEKQHEHMKNMLEFWDITVEEIMTPRVQLDSLDSKTTVWEALEYYMAHTHSRIPIYEWTVDKVIGILTIRNLVSEKDRSKPISDIILKKPMKVPLNQPIDNMLFDFQKTHTVIAVVIDEYGGVAWIVTLEDIVEEIFGEIRDETDKEAEQIENIWKNIYKIDSNIGIEDVLFLYNLEEVDFGWTQDKFDWETLSYVLTHIVERFPQKGESIKLEYKKEDLDGNEEPAKQDKKSTRTFLECRVLEISDWNMWKVQVRTIEIEDDIDDWDK